MIAIIDYGMGNLSSIANMFRKIGHKAVVTNSQDLIAQASKLILPGVGAFNNGMYQISQLNLLNILNKKVIEDKIPILGICLGMQLMCKKSEEGSIPGLSWIDAEVVRFRNISNDQRFRIPHIGWNYVEVKNESKLFLNIEIPKFYFVHSYHLISGSPGLSITTTNYYYDFISSFEYENILGVQFHPEKSHNFGMKLLKNFVELY